MQNMTAEIARPHGAYRDLFYQRLLACGPSSVLDLGCGTGSLLRRLAKDGIRAVGVEPGWNGEPEDLEVLHMMAEALPLADKCFDWVVCEFTAHHFQDIAAVFAEAARVSRKGFALIDQWYDPGIPSQVTAERFDRWCKDVDRSTGMVHNPSLSSRECLELISNCFGTSRIEIMTMFIPMNITAEVVRDTARRMLEPLPSPSRFASSLDQILTQIPFTGFTDDGAILAFVDFDPEPTT